MYPVYRKFDPSLFPLRQDDINGIQHLYGNSVMNQLVHIISKTLECLSATYFFCTEYTWISYHFNFLHKLFLLGPSPNTHSDQRESAEIEDPTESKDPALPNTCGPNLTFDAVTTFRGEIVFFKDK